MAVAAQPSAAKSQKQVVTLKASKIVKSGIVYRAHRVKNLRVRKAKLVLRVRGSKVTRRVGSAKVRRGLRRGQVRLRLPRVQRRILVRMSKKQARKKSRKPGKGTSRPTPKPTAPPETQPGATEPSAPSLPDLVISIEEKEEETPNPPAEPPAEPPRSEACEAPYGSFGGGKRNASQHAVVVDVRTISITIRSENETISAMTGPIGQFGSAKMTTEVRPARSAEAIALGV